VAPFQVLVEIVETQVLVRSVPPSHPDQVMLAAQVAPGRPDLLDSPVLLVK
jgi:hypothetical protein